MTDVKNRELAGKWTGLNTFLFLLRTVWFVVGVASLLQQPMTEATDYLLPAGFFLSFLLPQLFFRPQLIRPLAYAGLEIVLTGGLYLYTSTLYEGDPLFNFLYMPLTIGYMTGRKGLWYAAPLVVAVIPLTGFWLGNGGGALELRELGAVTNTLVSYLAFYGLGLALSLLVSEGQRIRELMADVREKNAALEQYSQQIERITLLEERSRLARDLHDTVGHTLTSVIIGMDAVRYQIDGAPEEAKEHLRELLASTRQGLDATRRSIHRLADDPTGSLLEEVRRLASEFERSTGTELELSVNGEEIAVPQGVRLTAVRCVQEGLTNAKRHGQASRVRLALSFVPEQLEVMVADNGSGFEKLLPGFGLCSMEERVATLQGSLALSSQPGKETVLRCILPLVPVMGMGPAAGRTGQPSVNEEETE